MHAHKLVVILTLVSLAAPATALADESTRVKHFEGSDSGTFWTTPTDDPNVVLSQDITTGKATGGIGRYTLEASELINLATLDVTDGKWKMTARKGTLDGTYAGYRGAHQRSSRHHLPRHRTDHRRHGPLLGRARHDHLRRRRQPGHRRAQRHRSRRADRAQRRRSATSRAATFPMSSLTCRPGGRSNCHQTGLRPRQRARSSDRTGAAIEAEEVPDGRATDSAGPQVCPDSPRLDRPCRERYWPSSPRRRRRPATLTRRSAATASCSRASAAKSTAARPSRSRPTARSWSRERPRATTRVATTSPTSRSPASTPMARSTRRSAATASRSRTSAPAPSPPPRPSRSSPTARSWWRVPPGSAPCNGTSRSPDTAPTARSTARSRATAR